MRSGSQYNVCFIYLSKVNLCLLLLMIAGCASLNKNEIPKSYQEVSMDHSYYQNGNLEYEAEYINGKLDGLSRYWSENGVLISESEYSNGQPHGSWKNYHSNEKLMNETTYFHGQKHGYEKWYYENGQLQSEQKYEYGEAIKDLIRWNPDGSIIY